MNPARIISHFRSFPDGSGAPARGDYDGFSFACHLVAGEARITVVDDRRASRRERLIAIRIVTKAYLETVKAAVTTEWMGLHMAMYSDLAAAVR